MNFEQLKQLNFELSQRFQILRRAQEDLLASDYEKKKALSDYKSAAKVLVETINEVEL